LEKPLAEYDGKPFNKSRVLSVQEERGAYWIRNFEDVIKAFEVD
jgi:site-specific DNA-methyltransferase (adenine-specific)